MDIAGLLIDASAPASAVAEHLIRGASPGDGDAVALLGRAAREAAPQAPAVAVEVLERAVELSGPDERVRQGLLADLAMNLMWAGRMDDAESVAREALETGLGPNAEGQLQGHLGPRAGRPGADDRLADRARARGGLACSAR